MFQLKTLHIRKDLQYKKINSEQFNYEVDTLPNTITIEEDNSKLQYIASIRRDLSSSSTSADKNIGIRAGTGGITNKEYQWRVSKVNSKIKIYCSININ